MCNLYAKSLRILRGKLGDISLEIDISTVYFFFDFVTFSPSRSVRCETNKPPAKIGRAHV